ncbi:metallophosphoesterase [Planctomycetota bacterium]
MIVLLYNFLVLAALVGCFGRLWRVRPNGCFQSRDTTVFLYLGSLALILALILPGDSFAKLQLIACWVFWYLPILLVVFVWRLEKHRRNLRVALGSFAVIIVAVGIDAFWIEPQALNVTYRRFHSDKLDRPMRIAVLADIQTDIPGDYEARVFARVKQEQPDLILFAGDYIQVEDRQACLAATHKLNALLKQTNLNPPLGKIAVQGNIDFVQPWQSVFTDTGTWVLEQTQTLDLGPVIVTCLSMAQSYDIKTSVTAQDKYHIVLGHIPNYALGDINADLLLAGHTHGGQVRLPFIGTLLTFSAVPRAWAAGQTEIAPGKTLLVSRGLGLERGPAPRLRFLCRPELAIVDVVPIEQ